MMDDYTMTVFPGQNLSSLIENKLNKNVQGNNQSLKIQIGPGIIQNDSQIVPLRVGTLQNLKQGLKFTLNSPQKRYFPLQNDLVIGIITARLSEFFRVDIGSQTTAILTNLNGFEGATKKNRPNWNTGTIIFARIAIAHPDLEPELACFDPSGNIPIDLFGELGASDSISTLTSVASVENSKQKSKEKTSILLRTSCNFSKNLQNPTKDALISVLGRYFDFEIAVGANGRIFIEAGNARESGAIYQLIFEIYMKRIKNLEEIENKIRNTAIELGKHKNK